MKKISTLLSIAVICIATTASAQNSSPYWSLTGNNNETGTSKLGTTNSVSLHFYTNNVQRMYIDSANGRVGIGVVAPQDRLHVNSATGENPFRAQVNGATRLLVHSNGGVAIGANTTPPPNGGLYIFGNTGIGTVNPSYKLDVTGDINISSPGLLRIGGDAVLQYNSPNQSVSVGNGGGTGTRLNTAVGYQALNSNTTGQANVAIGHKSLFSDNIGYSNVAIGSHALYSNTTGLQSIAIGDSALYSVTDPSGTNVAIGSKALFSFTSGIAQTAIGFHALYANTGPNYSNTAVGYNSLERNTTGGYNTSIGTYALQDNTTGTLNTAIGQEAGEYITTGSDNTMLGYLTEISDGTFFNATALGSEATATASNEVMLGSSSVTAVEAYAPYFNVSDGRIKKNIKENVPGLAFIKQLRPVTYNYDIHAANDRTGLTALHNKQRKDASEPDQATHNKATEDAMSAKEKMLYTGFVAQEVEVTARKFNYDFSGIHHPANDKDLYALSYSDFVVPLVKAVQELSKLNDSKQQQIDSLNESNQLLNNKLDAVTERLTKIESALHITNNNASAVTVSNSVARLEQNVPNPFHNTTTVAYHLPAGASSAQIVLTDEKGTRLQTIPITDKGTGQVSIATGSLAAGNYFYSLLINGRLMDTKQMMLAK